MHITVVDTRDGRGVSVYTYDKRGELVGTQQFDKGKPGEAKKSVLKAVEAVIERELK